MLANDYNLHEFAAGDRFTIGPFHLTTRSLQHFVPNVGVRLTVDDVAIAYTGDGGADAHVDPLAAGVALLLAEAPSPSTCRKTPVAGSAAPAKLANTPEQHRSGSSC